MARLSALLLALYTAGASAEIVRYTEAGTGPDEIALGYPVPLPRASASAFDGFRDHASLIGQLSALAAREAQFSRHELGSSLNGQSIYGFVFGQPAGSAPAVLQTGAVHAREWAAPEVVTHIAERLVAGLGSNGLERYLADRLSIMLAPVMNPDGFVATQQEPERTRIGEDPDHSSSDPLYPRDGRQRRKNLRDSDGLLETPADSLSGVDLNRNIGRFWSSSRASSSDPRSIVYHGSARESEPETRALMEGARLLGGDRLRLFIDTHSFSRVYFYNDTGNIRLRNLTRSLASMMGRVSAEDYPPVQEPSQSGIGANDEYFAYDFEVPSYTLELEPGFALQSAEYGGNPDVSHSGFILPEAEIARVREEAYLMALIGYYHQAGPPILEGVEVRRDDQTIFAAHWQTEGAGRRLVIDKPGVVSPGVEYSLHLRFDKPMRWTDERGAVGQYPGQLITLAPFVELAGASGRRQELSDTGQWLSRRYRFDSYALTFQADSALGQHARLEVSVRDLSGQALDADPSSMARWQNGHWVGYESSDGVQGDAGGTDSQICLRLDSSASADCQNSAGGGSGSPGLALLLAMLCGLRRRLT